MDEELKTLNTVNAKQPEVKKSNIEDGKNRVLRFMLLCTFVLLVIVSTALIVCFVSFKTCERSPGKVKGNDICLYSEEAKRINLRKFLDKVVDEYFTLHPEYITWHPEATSEMIRKRFKIHDPKPENIKRVSDRAQLLLNEAVNLNPDVTKLKPREHKAYLQAIHYLRFNFGKPWALYKSGLWLLGPSSFCYESICYLSSDILNSFDAFRPSSRRDIDKILMHFGKINQSVYDYIDVLKTGIAKGMVRTRSACMAGFDAFKALHMEINRNGAKGVREQDYAKQFYKSEYYRGVSERLHHIYTNEYGLNVTLYIMDNVEEYIGKSVNALLVYLGQDYYNACRPDNNGPGGLSALPLDVIYYNASVIPGSKTDPYLPLCSGETCRINGSLSYAMILGFYTTKDLQPSEVSKIGWENVERIYPQMVDIARKVTKISDEDKAVKVFQTILRDLKQSYFNHEPLPANQSTGEAYTNCISDETAKKYCPQRWQAMMNWFRFAEMVMSMHDGNTIDFFFFTGKQKTTPSCPVKLRVDYTPSSAAQSYVQSDYYCTTPSYYYIPFFLENVGPKYTEYTTSAHEARPGHHTQLQGMTENFQRSCGGPEQFLHDFTYYTAFSEGWALYAEYPLIAEGTTIYENNLMQKYGMLNWQMWRAVRLIIDTGLHYNGLSRARSLDILRKYVWEYTDIGRKEVSRYQSNPGQATAYLIGQLDIWRLRNLTKEKLQNKFSLKEFHLQILSQGSSPLAFLQSHINRYIECKLGTSQQYCDTVLNPITKRTADEPRYNIKGHDTGIKLKRRHYI